MHDFAILPLVIDIIVNLLDETRVLKVSFVYYEEGIRRKGLLIY